MPLGTQSLGRRWVATVSATVLAAALTLAGASAPAGAAPVKGDLIVVSVTDIGSGLGEPVQDRPFNVVVEVVDADGQPLAVNQATSIVLEEVSGPGELGDNTQAIVPRDGSSTTISGATYSQYANGVELRVRAVSGVELTPAEVTIDVALTAVGRPASPEVPLELTDPACVTPTAEVPTCGYFLLPNGARGNVTLSLGSCDGVPTPPGQSCRTAGSTEALVVKALADLGDLYSTDAPATLVVACDKVLCGQAGVPHLPLLYDLENTPETDLKVAPLCPAKGVLGEDQEACYDEVQSTRHDGDLYSHLLFAHDARASHP
jgi:hypothetical protein